MSVCTTFFDDPKAQINGPKQTTDRNSKSDIGITRTVIVSAALLSLQQRKAVLHHFFLVFPG